MRSGVMLAALACLALGACATDGLGAAGRRVAYACDDGARVDVTFLRAQDRGVLRRRDGDAAVLRRGETSIVLARQPAASGFRYAADGTAISGKGDGLRIESGAAAPLHCRAT